MHRLAARRGHHEVVTACLRRIKAWVAAHPEVKKAFDQDAATADGKTWSEALDILIDHYAGE